MKADIKAMETHELATWIEGLGHKPYRARQLRKWMFQKYAGSFDEMTDLPKVLRHSLDQSAQLISITKIKTLISTDGTKKFLFILKDGLKIESVLIPEREHFTLCISSQVGCAMGCRFCLTARQGFTRNLTPSEIIDQIIEVKREIDDPSKLTNIVFMGMGEPLANYESVLKALRIIINQDGMNFSRRRVTLSTCGIVPGIRRLGQEIQVNLAVSLNATNNSTRSFLMPVNRKYPLDDLISVCRTYPLQRGRRITFEYVLMDGINDTDDDALRLSAMLKGIKAKINLIPFNPSPGIAFQPPPKERLFRFQEILIKNNFTAIIRKSKGQDIGAACGQLSSLWKQEMF
jgi:23S rRNA (adenine2503-C2)-methyltransferase